MRAIQNYERDAGRIPPRSARFPYMQDFWTNGWFGDLLAFSLIDIGVIAAAYETDFEPGIVMAAATAGYVATWIFFACAVRPGRQHPDWGYLKIKGEWRPTLGGRIHVVYFFLQSSVALLGILVTIFGNAGTLPLIVGWTGAGLYAIAALRDFHEGLLTP